MSALYGRVIGDAAKTEATRRGHHSIVTRAETWQGIIRVEVNRGGGFDVTMMDKHGNSKRVLVQGNLDALTVSDVCEPDAQELAPMA